MLENQSRYQLISLLDTLNIESKIIEHQPIYTVSESDLVKNIIPGAHTKNLFLKDDHKCFWLISALQDTQINLRMLAKNLPAKNLRFAKPQELRQYLKVEPGSVTWFALINDKKNSVNAILDVAIFNHGLVGFHPLVNTATTVLKPNSLIKFTQAIGHTYQIVDFS